MFRGLRSEVFILGYLRRPPVATSPMANLSFLNSKWFIILIAWITLSGGRRRMIRWNQNLCLTKTLALVKSWHHFPDDDEIKYFSIKNTLFKNHIIVVGINTRTINNVRKTKKRRQQKHHTIIFCWLLFFFLLFCFIINSRIIHCINIMLFLLLFSSFFSSFFYYLFSIIRRSKNAVSINYEYERRSNNAKTSKWRMLSYKDETSSCYILKCGCSCTYSHNHYTQKKSTK